MGNSDTGPCMDSPGRGSAAGAAAGRSWGVTRRNCSTPRGRSGHGSAPRRATEASGGSLRRCREGARGAQARGDDRPRDEEGGEATGAFATQSSGSSKLVGRRVVSCQGGAASPLPPGAPSPRAASPSCSARRRTEVRRLLPAYRSHYGNSTMFSCSQSVTLVQRAAERELYWDCLLVRRWIPPAVTLPN